MEQPFFTIIHDHSGRLAKVTLCGFWDAGTVEDFKLAIVGIIERRMAVGLPPGASRVLLVVDQLPVQRQALTGELAGLVTLFGQLTQRLAIVAIPGSLIWLQVRRLVGDVGRIFVNEQDALAWLSSKAD